MDTIGEVERLTAELIATGTMNEDTLTDLARYKDEAAAGTLHADDLDYLRALHARILALPLPEASVTAAPQATDRLFDEIRRRFAERFDPETGTSNLGAETRALVHAEFWPEFESVARG